MGLARRLGQSGTPEETARQIEKTWNDALEFSALILNHRRFLAEARRETQVRQARIDAGLAELSQLIDDALAEEAQADRDEASQNRGLETPKTSGGSSRNPGRAGSHLQGSDLCCAIIEDEQCTNSPPFLTRPAHRGWCNGDRLRAWSQAVPQPVRAEPGSGNDLMPLVQLMVKPALHQLLRGIDSELRSLGADPRGRPALRRRPPYVSAPGADTVGTRADRPSVLRWYGVNLRRCRGAGCG